MAKVRINLNTDLIIPDKYVKKLVTKEYRNFLLAYNKVTFDGPDDYATVVREYHEFINYAKLPQKKLSIHSAKHMTTVELDKKLEPVSKALANIYVAAYNLGVTLAIGYIYNENESDIKFALPASCLSIRLTKSGKEMTQKLGVNDILYTQELCNE